MIQFIQRSKQSNFANPLQKGTKMIVTKFTMKFLGKKLTYFRVLDKNGEVLHVACSEPEAIEWLTANT